MADPPATHGSAGSPHPARRGAPRPGIDRLPVAELRIDAGRDHTRAGDDDGVGIAVATEFDLRCLLRVLHRRAGRTLQVPRRHAGRRNGWQRQRLVRRRDIGWRRCRGFGGGVRARLRGGAGAAMAGAGSGGAVGTSVPRRSSNTSSTAPSDCGASPEDGVCLNQSRPASRAACRPSERRPASRNRDFPSSCPRRRVARAAAPGAEPWVPACAEMTIARQRSLHQHGGNSRGAGSAPNGNPNAAAAAGSARSAGRSAVTRPSASTTTRCA